MRLSDYAPAETVEGEVRWLRRAEGDGIDWYMTVHGLRLPDCPGLGLVLLERTWRVTHQPSGLEIVRHADLDHARRAATALVALCPGWDRAGDDIEPDADAHDACVRVREMIALEVPDGR